MKYFALIFVALFTACGSGVPPSLVVVTPDLPRHCQAPVIPPRPPAPPRTVAAIALWGNQAYASALINAARLRACAEHQSDLYQTTKTRSEP